MHPLLFAVFRAIPRATVSTLTLLAATSLELLARQSLEAPGGTISPGEPLRVTLLYTNENAAPATWTPPPTLPLTAISSNGQYSVNLRPAAAVAAGTGGSSAFSAHNVEVAPGGFHRVDYTGQLPAGLAGLIVLDGAEVGLSRIAVEVSGAGAARAADALAPTESSEGVALPYQTAGRGLGISPHEPVYFSLGAHDGLNARFQFSLKFRPFGPTDERTAGAGWWEDTYLAFTQTSIWDLDAQSKPFHDTSYRPAAFFNRYNVGRVLGADFGYAAGFEHESNGKSGADSRSINILFFRPTLRWSLSPRWSLVLSPRVFTYVEKEDNPDIADYRGYGEFVAAAVDADGWKIVFTGRLGESGRGSLQLDASLPTRKIGLLSQLGIPNGYLHLQYFNGHGESLIDYDRKLPSQVRLGLMLVR